MVDTGLTWEVSILRLKECLGFIVIFISLHPADATEPLIKHMGEHNLLFTLRALGLLQSPIHWFLGSPSPFHSNPKSLLLEWRRTVMFEFLILGTLGNIVTCSSLLLLLFLPSPVPSASPGSLPRPTTQSKEGKRAPCLSQGEHHGSDKDGYDPAAEP